MFRVSSFDCQMSSGETQVRTVPFICYQTLRFICFFCIIQAAFVKAERYSAEFVNMAVPRNRMGMEEHKFVPEGVYILLFPEVASQVHERIVEQNGTGAEQGRAVPVSAMGPVGGGFAELSNRSYLQLASQMFAAAQQQLSSSSSVPVKAELPQGGATQLDRMLKEIDSFQRQ